MKPSSSGRRKRVITKARKEQNRIAQQLYRELAHTSLVAYSS
jgi:hypothetical protein